MTTHLGFAKPRITRNGEEGGKRSPQVPLRLFLPALVLLAVLAGVLWQSTANEAQAYLPPAATSQLALDSANDDPWGIWVGADTVWVSDPSDRKLYAYTKNPWRRDSSKDFSLVAANSQPHGIWSDGTHMFVANVNPKFAYAYKMSDRSYNAAKNIPLDSSANDLPAGMWGDHRNIWVSNSSRLGSTARIVSYDAANSFRAGRNRDESEDFDALTAAGNTDPMGIFGDGRVMWVADLDDGKVYAYDQLSQHRLSGKDFDLDNDNTTPQGIWSNGNDMWVVDNDDDAIYVYERTRTEIWSATLTVGGTFSVGYLGVTGSISDNTFTYGGVDYRVVGVVDTGPTPVLKLHLNEHTLPLAGLTLHAGDSSYEFSDATLLSGPVGYGWSVDAGWSSGQTIELSITGVPVVTVARVNTQVQHGLSATPSRTSATPAPGTPASRSTST